MRIVLVSQRLQASVGREVREACRGLDLEIVDWAPGGVPGPAIAVVGELTHGERRIPAEFVALLEATPGLRLVLCTQELLVKPRIMLGDGRICVLGPPIERDQVSAALRALIAPTPASPPQDGARDHRFEVLRRSHWVAWTRGRSGPAISLHEQRGATVVIGAAPGDRAAIADAVAGDQPDAERAAALGKLAGSSGVAHLTRDAGEWVMYWPSERCPLWICSPNRSPARWNAARGIAAAGDRRLIRLRAFPEDQLIAAWSEPGSGSGSTGMADALAPVWSAVVDGGAETILRLDDVASRADHVTGLVMEVR